MKNIIPNMMFMVLGIIVFLFQCFLKFNGILGWLLITIGIILISVGLFYESNKSKKNLFGFILDLIFSHVQ